MQAQPCYTDYERWGMSPNLSFPQALVSPFSLRHYDNLQPHSDCKLEFIEIGRTL